MLSIRSAGGMKSSTAVFVEEFFAFQTRDVSVGFVAFLVAYVFFSLLEVFVVVFCCVSFHIPLWHDMVSPVFCNLLQELCCSSQGSQVPALNNPNNHHYHHLLHCTTMVKIFKQQRNTWQTYELVQVFGSLQCLSIAFPAPFPSMSKWSINKSQS